MKKFCAYIVLISMLVGIYTNVYADEIKITANVDKTRLELGDVVRYTIAVYGTLDKVRLRIPPLKDFSIRFGPNIRLDSEIIDGSALVFYKYLFGLVPRKTGNLKIGPTTLYYKKKRYETGSFDIEVDDRTPF